MQSYEIKCTINGFLFWVKKNELFMWAQKQKDPLEWRA